jgi:hypothetical protein
MPGCTSSSTRWESADMREKNEAQRTIMQLKVCEIDFWVIFFGVYGTTFPPF